MTATRITLSPRPDTGVPEDVPARAAWCRLDVGDDGTSRGVPHVNNAEYVRYVDRIAELVTDDAGFTRETMLAENRMWFVARHEIDYRAEVFSGERLLAATWIGDWSRTTVTRETRMIRPADGVLVCAASTRWAWMDLDRRRPTRIPDAMRAVFETEAEADDGTSRS